MSEPIIPPTLENLQVIPPAEKDAFNLKKDLRARMVELKGVILQEEKEYKSLSLEIQTLLTSPPSPPTVQTTLSSYLESNPHLQDSLKRRRHSDSASFSEADAQGEDTDDFDGMGDETMDGVEEEARTQAEGDGVADYLLDVPDEDDDDENDRAGTAQTNGNGFKSTEGLVDPVKVDNKRGVISILSDEEEDAPPSSTLPPPSNGIATQEPSSSAQDPLPEAPPSTSKPSSNSLSQPPVSIVTPASPPPPSNQLAQQSSSTEEAFAASQGSNQSFVPATPSPPPEAGSSSLPSALAGPSNPTPSKAESSRLLSPSASNATLLSPPSVNPGKLPPTRGSGTKSSGQPKDRDHSPSSSSGFSSDLGDEEEENERERRLSEVGLVDGPPGANPPSSTKSNPTHRTRGAAASSEQHAQTSPSASSAFPATTYITTNRLRKKSFSTSFDPKTKRRSSVSPLPSSRHDLGLPSHRTLSHGHMSRPEDLVDDDATIGEVPDYDGPLPPDVWGLKDSKDRRAIKERKARQDIARAKRIEEIREEARKTVEKEDADAEGEEDDGGLVDGEMDVDEGEDGEVGGGVKLEELDESFVGGEGQDATSSSSKKALSAKDKGKGKEVLKRDATEDVSMDGEGENDEEEEATEEPEEVVIPPEQRKGRSRSSAAAVADPTPVKSNKGKGHPKGKMPPRTIAALVAASEPSVKDTTPTASEDGDLDGDGSFIETASQISRNSAAPPSVANSTGGTSERRNKNGTKQKTTKQRQDEKAAGLTETEAAELHEKRKLDRRIRDRARRERDKAISKAEEDARAVEAEAEAEGENEDGTSAKRYNKKRKATQGKNKSPPPDHDRATKKRREEMSATPEGGARSSSRHASSSRQPSSSRPPANSRPPSIPPPNARAPSPALLLPPAPNPQLQPKNFKKAIDLLFQGISQHRSSSIFQIPIKDADAPSYSSTVLRPMDLRTIKSRIKDGGIKNVDEFERDVLLMFANAMLYNEPSTEVHRMAEEMMGEAEKQIREWRHLQWKILHGAGSNGD